MLKGKIQTLLAADLAYNNVMQKWKRIIHSLPIFVSILGVMLVVGIWIYSYRTSIRLPYSYMQERCAATISRGKVTISNLPREELRSHVHQLQNAFIIEWNMHRAHKGLDAYREYQSRVNAGLPPLAPLTEEAIAEKKKYETEKAAVEAAEKELIRLLWPLSLWSTELWWPLPALLIFFMVPIVARYIHLRRHIHHVRLGAWTKLALFAFLLTMGLWIQSNQSSFGIPFCYHRTLYLATLNCGTLTINNSLHIAHVTSMHNEIKENKTNVASQLRNAEAIKITSEPMVVPKDLKDRTANEYVQIQLDIREADLADWTNEQIKIQRYRACVAYCENQLAQWHNPPGDLKPRSISYRYALGVLSLILSGIVLLSFRRWYRPIRMMKTGHCIYCGYDLRASPARCPECGTTNISRTCASQATAD